MSNIKSKRVLLLCVLLVTIISSVFLTYQNTNKVELVLSKEKTYFLPGQKNNCKWILQVSQDLKNIPGETTEIRIGIPEAQSLGYISGRIEVGPHNTLILAFIPPGSQQNKVPVILTADYSEKELPVDFIRFRWVQSSAITILIFSSEDSCNTFRNKK
jgi:hypothetical protein